MPLAVPDIEYLRDLVSRRSGNVLTNEQDYLFENRLSPLAQKYGLTNVASLVAELRRSNNPALQERVSEAMTINETSFFRDVHPFEAMRTQIVPAVLQARQATKQLSIWCAASSSGQEPYSLAILLKEHFPQLANWNVRILATDLSDEMLAKARSGKYSQFEVNRGLPSKLLMTHFTRQGTEWIVKDDVRRLVEFRKLNLTQPWPYIAPCDIVFIRNVLIYFDQPTKQSILERVLKVLQPDGYLFVGASETLLNLNLPVRREEIKPTVVYRPTQSLSNSGRFTVPH
jgi:chemotaxis protein methyltransferase CheR